MLVLFSMALFVVPNNINIVHAQSGVKTFSFCFDTISGGVTFVADTSNCITDQDILIRSYNANQLGVCSVLISSTGKYQPFPPNFDKTGKIPQFTPPWNASNPGGPYKCLGDDGEELN